MRSFEVLETGVAAETSRLEYIGVAPTCIVIFQMTSGDILFVRQYREIFQNQMLELPGGGVVPGEDIHQAALREMKEETGYEFSRVEHLAAVAASVGTSNEIVHIFIANPTDAISTFEQPEVGIELIWMRPDEAIDTMLAQPIADAKSLLGLTLLLRRAMTNRAQSTDSLN